jgi:prepilin-type N-terminal cleavage/methylation domain-containing protein
MRSRGCAHSSRGFTLTELIVVMAIVGLLSSLILGGVMAARKRGAKMNAQTLITQLEAAIEHYEQHYGDFPYGTGGVASAEFLYMALSSSDWPSDFELNSDQILDTDKNDLDEIVDHWLQPVSYYHHRSYSGPPKESSYRLISIGPDEEEGTRDDITNFR